MGNYFLDRQYILPNILLMYLCIRMYCIFGNTLHTFCNTLYFFGNTLHTFCNTLHICGNTLHTFCNTLHICGNTLHTFGNTFYTFCNTLHIFGITLHTFCITLHTFCNITAYFAYVCKAVSIVKVSSKPFISYCSGQINQILEILKIFR